MTVYHEIVKCFFIIGTFYFFNHFCSLSLSLSQLASFLAIYWCWVFFHFIRWPCRALARTTGLGIKGIPCLCKSLLHDFLGKEIVLYDCSVSYGWLYKLVFLWNITSVKHSTGEQEIAFNCITLHLKEYIWYGNIFKKNFHLNKFQNSIV